MANWEKLDAEFFDTINALSSNDWQNWHSKKEQRRNHRKAEIQLKAKMHLSKIFFSQLDGGDVLVDEKDKGATMSNVNDFSFLVESEIKDTLGDDKLKGNTQYAMAA